MNLIIDAGNTTIKLAVFEKDELLELLQLPAADFPEAVSKIFQEFPKIGQAIISTVSFLNENDLASIKEKCPLITVDHQLKTPFKNHYATPETLGADRIALAAAAVLYYPKKNTLVVDAGTCVTYDMITSEGYYLGGAISPGLRMRYQALNHFTSRLPLLDPSDPPDIIGDSTENSIHSGVINGLCQEIEGVISLYETRYEFLTVILTGGDAQFLSKRLKKAIFAHSNFLLEGLNFLLEHNKR